MARLNRRKDSPYYDFTAVAQTSCGPPADAHPEHWDRREDGDVTNQAAFRAHMDRVGEEDQSEPGWDAGA